jgi:phosphatidylglycerol:prolipoprotein diacylglycerol transferase
MMLLPPTLLHVYGDFAIKTYGLCIVIGLLTGLWFIKQDPVRKKLGISFETILDGVQICTFFGILGARLLFAHETNMPLFSLQFFQIWNGGLSIQGAVLGVLTSIIFFSWYKKIKLFPLFELAATYAPLMQAIGRIGCLHAGCCHGQQAQCIVSIVYTDPESLAPLYTPLLPTQIMSSLLLFILFVLLYRYRIHFYKKPYITSWYFIGIGIERFIVDFWRADQGTLVHGLSYQQYISLGLIILGIFIGYMVYKRNESI